MSEAKRRHFLREREAAQLLDEFSQKLNLDLKQLFGNKIQIEVAETQDAKIFFVNNKPILAVLNDTLSPTFFFEEALRLLPKIVVNMGAVPHICNGADVMAPGVVRIEKEYTTNNYVVVADERHNKPIALVIALTDSQTALKMQHGKIAKNIHYVGDSLWNQLKKLTASGKTD
jgi:PUA domain protein